MFNLKQVEILNKCSWAKYFCSRHVLSQKSFIISLSFWAKYCCFTFTRIVFHQTFLLFPSQLNNQINCRLIVKLPILGWVGLSKKSCVLGKLLHLRHILNIIFHFIRNTPDNPKVGRVIIVLGPITFSESISFQLDQVSDNTQKTKSLI